MAAGTFYEKLDVLADQQRFLCVGLDPDPTKIPSYSTYYAPVDGAFDYMTRVVDQTVEIAGAFKPNSAFYERFGSEGVNRLGKLVSYIADVAPDVPIILDGKRGDIGNTNSGYVEAHFDEQNADALTINPYLGAVANSPFLDRADKGVIVLARTSNPGAAEFQDIPVHATDLSTMDDSNGERYFSDYALTAAINAHNGKYTFPLFAAVAANVRYRWNYFNNCAVVAGATYPKELELIRNIVGDYMPILIPGVGTQGGLADQSAMLGSNKHGRRFLINVSSGISAPGGNKTFGQAAQDYHEQILKGLDDKHKAGL